MKITQTLITLLAGGILATSIFAGQDESLAPTRTIQATASIKPVAPKVGENVLEVVFTEGDKPLGGLKLTSTVGMTSMDMGTAHPPVKETSPGHYRLTPTFLMDGPWRVTLVSAKPKFAVNFDMSSGAKKAWQAVKQTITVAGTPLVKEPPLKPEPTSTPPKKADPAPPEEVKPNPMNGMDMTKPSYGSGMAPMDHSVAVRPQLKEKSSYLAKGNEAWDIRTGFGKFTPMVAMMTQMMVGGSGMEGMKMAPMDMKFDESNFTEGGDSTMQGMPAMEGMKGQSETNGSASANSRSLKVEAKLDKAGVGDNNVSITIMTPDGKPVEKAKVTTAVAMTSMDMGTTHPAVKELGKGKYSAKANFSMGGPWRLTLTVTAPGMKPSTYSFDFEAK